MSKSKCNLSAALRARAEAVDLRIDTMQASDGTWWIHSIQKWRSISWIRKEIERRNDDDDGKDRMWHGGLVENESW